MNKITLAFDEDKKAGITINFREWILIEEGTTVSITKGFYPGVRQKYRNAWEQNSAWLACTELADQNLAQRIEKTVPRKICYTRPIKGPGN